MIGRRSFFGSTFRGAVAAICGAIGFRSARPAEAGQIARRRLVTNSAGYYVPEPMTVDRAVAILCRQRYRGAVWFRMGTEGSVFGHPPHNLAFDRWPHLYSLELFAAVAVAEKLEREQPLFRATAVAGHCRHEVVPSSLAACEITCDII